MPTGYTAQLEKMEYNTEKWLTESVIRAFGMCVMLRDDNMSLSNEEILAKLKNDHEDSYYTENLARAKRALAAAEKKPIRYWTTEHRKALAAAKKRYKDDLKKKAEKKKKYTKVLNTCEKLLAKAQAMELDGHEEIVNPLKFAIEQINTCSNEWTVDDYYKKPIADYEEMSVEDFKKEVIDGLKHDIEYYDEQLQKTKVSDKERISSFETFTNFIKNNIGKV